MYKTFLDINELAQFFLSEAVVLISGRIF